MKIRIALFAGLVLAASIGWTAVTQDVAEEMIDRARHFLVSLDPDQRDQATFAFGDDERLNWHFIPRDREGTPVRGVHAAPAAARRPPARHGA